MREYKYYWAEEQSIQKVLVTYEGYNPLEKVPMKDQVEEVKKKVKEFENQLVDLLKGEIERILTKIETAK